MNAQQEVHIYFLNEKSPRNRAFRVCQEKCVSIFKYLLTLSEVAYLKQINLTDTPKARQLYFRVSWLICYRHFVLETDVLINAVPEQIIDHELIQYHRPVRNIAGCPLLL